MEIRIQQGLQGLDRLQGAVVILDIFRASNTIIALLEAGAAGVALIAGLEQARALKAEHPDWLLLGERKGLTPPGFEGGNSPVAARGMALKGRRVILTTSAGTQALPYLSPEVTPFYGSFANAAALVGHLRRLDPPAVHLLPMGLEAKEPAREDDLAADYLARLLAGERPDFSAYRQGLLHNDGAARLRRLGQHDDLEFCTSLDVSSLVPQVKLTSPPWAVALGVAAGERAHGG